MTGSMTQLQSLELVLLALLIAVAGISGIARRFSLSYPIVLVIVGLASSLIPGLPRIPLPPDVVFFVFLPPLLFAAAWQTSWREFTRNFTSISLLAFGLVLFTALGVAYTAHFFLPTFDWRIGFLLGAIVSPTDAVAASSIASKVGMPQRIVSILEGESLLNDATGLVLLEFGIDMIVHGTTPTLGTGSLRLLWLIGIGTVLGFLIGYIVSWVERLIDDGPVEIAISLIVPYVCYLAGESLHASGAMATIVCGLYMSRKSTSFFSPASRLQATAVWDAVEFLLNGLVFILIGLQLPLVVAGLHEFTRTRLIFYGFSFSAVLIALRMAWMYPSAWVAYRLRRLLQHETGTMPNPRGIFVIGWSGMRGVLALAAASALPYTLANGQPFQQRNLLVFLTFCVILVTLVLQGLSLAPLIRLLRLDGGSQTSACEEAAARRILLQAAIDSLEQGHQQHGHEVRAYKDLLRLYRHRLEDVAGSGTTAEDADERTMMNLIREAGQTERTRLTELYDSGQIGDTLYRTLERELDLSESRLSTMP